MNEFATRQRLKHNPTRERGAKNPSPSVPVEENGIGGIIPSNRRLTRCVSGR